MSRKHSWLVLLVAVLALAAVVAVRPPHAPPLYDGLGFPDEPYRWVTPPAGATKTPQAATPASAVVSVGGGRSAAARGYSAEQGPQVAFAAAEGAFAAAAGVTSFQVSAVPQPAPAAPDGGVVVSNLYRFSATARTASGGAAVPLAAGANLVINLRADQATSQTVVISAWDGTRWTQLPTRQVGTEIYATQLPALGLVAAVRLNPGVTPRVAAPAPSAGASTGASAGASAVPGTGGAGTGDVGNRTLWLVLGGGVVLLAAGLLVLRRRTGGTDD